MGGGRMDGRQCPQQGGRGREGEEPTIGLVGGGARGEWLLRSCRDGKKRRAAVAPVTRPPVTPPAQ